MAGKHRFFVVAWNEGIEFAIYIDGEPTDTVAHWLQLIPAALDSQRKQEDEKTELLVPGDTCLLFDWSLEELPAQVRVNQIPKPGVVFAVRKGSQLEYEDDQTEPEESGGDAPPAKAPETSQEERMPKSTSGPAGDRAEESSGEANEYALVYMLKRELWRGDSPYAKRLQAFISAPEAAYEPLPITRYDAFISYSTEDLALAKELADDLEARAMRTFLASRDLEAGTVWTEEVRQALLASRVSLIVLTPNSANRPWVMCEVGASWALGKPLVPALLYVDPKALPEVIAAYQSRRIETVQGRKALVEELVRLCLVGS